MTQTVIDELVVRMLGDGSQLLETYEAQDKAAERSAQVAGRSMEKMEAAYREGSLSAVDSLKELESMMKGVTALEEKRKTSQGDHYTPGSYYQSQVKDSQRLLREMGPQASIELSAERQLNDARDRGRQIVERSLSPKERMLRTEKEYAEVLRKGGLTQEEHDKALGKLHEEGEGRGRFGMRSMRMLSHAAIQFAGAKGDALKETHALTAGIRAIGMAFGPVGMIVSTVMGAVISNIDEAQKAANKGFMAIADGTKSLEQGLASMSFSGFKASLTKAVEEINPSSLWGGVKKQWKVGLLRTFGDKTQQDNAEEIVAMTALRKASDEVLEARKKVEEFANKDEGKAAIAKLTGYHATSVLKDLKEEIELRSKNVGLKGEDLKLERLRVLLDKGNASPRELLEFEKLKRDYAALETKTLIDAAQRRAAGAGLAPHEKKAGELLREGKVSRDVAGQISAWERYAKAVEDVGNMSVASDKKLAAFGKTAEQAAIDELRAAMKGGKLTPEQDDDARFQIGRLQSNARKADLQSLGEELRKYKEAMEGATAADKAAGAVKEGGNREQARQVELLHEAIRVTEQYMLPQDKYMQKQRELDELLKEKLITEQTYTRALGAEQAKLNKPATPVQGVAFGSAESLTRILAQQQALRPVDRLQLEGEGDLNKKVAGDADKKRNTTNDLLKEIRDALLKKEAADAAKDPAIKVGVGVAIGALGAGIF